MDFVSLSCPSCGAKLEVSKDLERFACAHCGNEFIVNRTSGIVSLKPVVEGLQKIGVSVDKTASELAIKRLKEEIKEFEENYASAHASWGKMRNAFGISIILVTFGFLLLLTGLVNNVSGRILWGLIFLIAGGIGSFLFYQSEKGWRIKEERILAEAKKKNQMLKKHQELVEQ